MALVNFQEEKDTKAAVLVFMTYSSGQVSSVITISQLIEFNETNSSWSPSYFFMMRLILPEYSTNFWRSPLSLAMCQLVHSLTSFRVRAVW